MNWILKHSSQAEIYQYETTVLGDIAGKRFCQFNYRCYRSMVCLTDYLSAMFVHCSHGRRYQHDFFCIWQPHVSLRLCWNLAYIDQPLPLQTLPQRDPPPVDLSIGDIQSQIAAEWLETAQCSQWRTRTLAILACWPAMTSPSPKTEVPNAPARTNHTMCGKHDRRAMSPAAFRQIILAFDSG